MLARHAVLAMGRGYYLLIWLEEKKSPGIFLRVARERRGLDLHEVERQVEVLNL